MGEMGTHSHVEIVQVVNKTYLTDADGNECKYFSNSGGVLERGHYVVIWPSNCKERRFDQDACFYGPYSLGLIAKLNVAEHVAAFASYSRSYAIRDDRVLHSDTH